MAQEPRYEVYRFNEEIKALQEKAIVEVLTSTPAEKQLRLGSYGLDKLCEELSEEVIRGMVSLTFRVSLGIYQQGIVEWTSRQVGYWLWACHQRSE
jgi:hypothetical protein